MFETNWVPSAAKAKALGIHPQTLRKLRRHQITPFKEGRDYRWVGLSTSSTLQWHIHSANQAFTDFRRMCLLRRSRPMRQAGSISARGVLSDETSH